MIPQRANANSALVYPFEASEKVLHIDTSLVLLEQFRVKHLKHDLGVTVGVDVAMGFEIQILLQLFGIGTPVIATDHLEPTHCAKEGDRKGYFSVSLTFI